MNDTPSIIPAPFVELLGASVTGARVLDKTHGIYFHFRQNQGRININGNCSEICRQFYGAQSPAGPEWTGEELAALVGYPGDPFTTRSLTEWLSTIRSAHIGSYDILDLLYWEQQMGNWGAQFPAEQDIAIEEFSPFNNRSLICTLLSVPASSRAAPHYRVYHRMIHELWPECLAEPIKSMSLTHRIVRALPSGVKVWAKRVLR